MTDNQPTASGVSEEMRVAALKEFERQKPSIIRGIDILAILEAALSAKPAQMGGEQAEDHMAQIDKVIADLQDIRAKWGNTCVYIRRFGFSWGAVALNRRDDDKKNGVFDLQARYEAMLLERAEQVERLIADRNEWRQKVWDAEKITAAPPQPIPTPDEAREHLAFLLFQSDWPKKADLQWNGDGTKDHPGHAKLKDMAFNRYCTLADVSIAALSRARPEEAAQVSDYVESLKEQYGNANDALREFAKVTGAPLGCSLHDWLRKYTAALKSKSAHSPAPRVEEKGMNELLHEKLREEYGSDRYFISEATVRAALAFGRAVMERKP